MTVISRLSFLTRTHAKTFRTETPNPVRNIRCNYEPEGDRNPVAEKNSGLIGEDVANSLKTIGAPRRNRTYNLWIKSPLLCQLS